MKLQPAVSPRQYELICRSIRHIGFKISDYESYRRSGSVENVAYYLVKTVFAQLFWAILIASLAGQAYLFAWFSAIFVATALIRDFNWRGHGAGLRRAKKSGWEFDANSRALNQYFYGWIASEWHDNHHKYPFSANNGFLPGQIDLAFQIIKLLRRLGIVKSYNDAKPLFKKDCLGLVAGAYGTAEE